MAVHIHPVDIPPRYYKPIGQIVAGANLTEVLIASIIWHFHNITDPNIGRLFTYYTNFEGKLRILKETVERRVPDKKLQYKLLTLHDDVPLSVVKAVAARARKLNQAFDKLMRDNGIPLP